jgi:hypothetical protein
MLRDHTARFPLTLLLVCLVAVLVAGCGSSKPTSTSTTGVGGVVVARVGDIPITRAEVSHWMETLAGIDYYPLSHGLSLPEGLISDPPNYPHCVARLEALAQASPSGVYSKITGPQLLTKCHELYQALKAQAVSYLTGADILINYAHEIGITATNTDTMHLFTAIKAREFPTEQALHTYLQQRRMTLADELFQVKYYALEQKAEAKLKTQGKQALAAFAQAETHWATKTTCQPGYIAEHCNNYNKKLNPETSPAVLMEQIAATITGKCINTTACTNE